MNKMISKVKGVGLMSGGLDSVIAAKIVKDLDVDVTMIHFVLPWIATIPKRIKEWTDRIGVQLVCLPLDQSFLKMIQNPPHGYGTAMNPCIDCKIHMLQKAKQYMDSIGADFVFTGEVLGQRPMSQNKRALDIIERETGLEGRLLRPLSAQRLPMTIPEQEGRIDRQKLLSIEGRSRQQQIRLAAHFGITDFAQPGGGCLLTERSFELRLRDLFTHEYRDPQDTIILKVGRHFRIQDHFKIIVGRSENENTVIAHNANGHDILLRLESIMGPLAVLQGNNPSQNIIAQAAGLIQAFSKSKNNAPENVLYWNKKDGEGTSKTILALKTNDNDVMQWKIS